jgi:hypothetical protein
MPHFGFRKTQFLFFMYLLRPNNGVENISLLYLPLFNSVLKKNFLGRRIIGGQGQGQFPPPPPKLTFDSCTRTSR